MKVTQEFWSMSGRYEVVTSGNGCEAPQLVIVFAAPQLLQDPTSWERLRKRWPTAAILAGSTAGEICGTRVLDDTLVATAIEFEKTRVQSARIGLSTVSNSTEAGRLLAEKLSAPDLVHVFVLSDGLKVNGSELVAGLVNVLGASVGVTGGLCGDGARFARTYVCVDDFVDEESVAGVGFYGSSLSVGCGSLGGWDSFGPERRVTRSEGNVLYELDGAPALELYERYLGEHAAGLPATGLLFPLTVRRSLDEPGVVRTILGVNRESKSLTFAGDVPNGCYARLMRANFERLLDGAAGAARTSYDAIGAQQPELGILISCVGRKLVLKQRIEEEIEHVQQVLGSKAALAGFYSYGEISPFTPQARCELHNQTMTITTLLER